MSRHLLLALVLVGCVSAAGDVSREPLVVEREEAGLRERSGSNAEKPGEAGARKVLRRTGGGLRPTIAVLPFVRLAASTKLHSKDMAEDQILKELRQRVRTTISSTACCVMLDRRRSADWLLVGEVAEFDVGMTKETTRGFVKTSEHAWGRASLALINVATGEKHEFSQVKFGWGGPISRLAQDAKLQEAKKGATHSTDLLLNWMSLDLAGHVEKFFAPMKVVKIKPEMSPPELLIEGGQDRLKPRQDGKPILVDIFIAQGSESGEVAADEIWVCRAAIYKVTARVSWAKVVEGSLQAVGSGSIVQKIQATGHE